MENEINELYPSARHAYTASGLAVKTSRPHNEIANYALSAVEGPNLSHFFIKEQFVGVCSFAKASEHRAIGCAWHLPLSLTLSPSRRLRRTWVGPPKLKLVLSEGGQS